MITSNKYSDMQRGVYDNHGAKWSLDNKNEVVGPFDAHNNWPDYKYLFQDIENHNEKTVLDFGCGPARNIVKYNPCFKRIDGIDISTVVLEKAKLWIQHNGIDLNNVTLHNCNGYDLSEIKDESYDIVMSTICLQHICVHEIRLNLFKEFFRVLKTGGFLTFQMGYGVPSPKTVSYYENFYEAKETNRAMDTSVEKIDFIEKDLSGIGFRNFKFYITPVGPGDFHPEWCWVNCVK